MSDQPQDTPLFCVLGLLTTAIHTIESELAAAQMPTFTLEPRWHPLDLPDAVPSPRLFEARRVAMASANLIKSLVQDVGTALIDMSAKTVDTASNIMTADIGLVDVFKHDEEKTRALHVDKMVSRLPQGKKVNPQKLARCLRLLSAEHWWTEPSPGVFAPTRWALLNTRDTPTWAFHDPPAWGAMIGCTAFTEHMTNPATMNADDIDSAPFVIDWHKRGNTQDANWWKWMEREPARTRAARSFRVRHGGCWLTLRTGYANIAAIRADYPWESLPPNTTLVDVGSGIGSVALHVLMHVYTTVPTLKVVLQDREGPVGEAKKYWAEEFPNALEDGHVEFEVHNFFEENRRNGPNTIYWSRFIMHDWHDKYAVKILKQIRAVCHSTSREDGKTLSDTFEAIDNNGPYEPISAPYPLPQNFGFATKVSNLFDILMLNNVNALERTLPEFEKIVAASGFKLAKVYPTRGRCGILELIPN
ncbi:S-adenosyl-L-methionine-dependent methyltransferase [Cerioporus squamosus]|nr:S-adenosyl-L-methionine-dependent methyltransferase [Cerioporus squamosus]